MPTTRFPTLSRRLCASLGDKNCSITRPGGVKEPGVTNVKGECCSSFYSNSGNWDDCVPPTPDRADGAANARRQAHGGDLGAIDPLGGQRAELRLDVRHARRVQPAARPRADGRRDRSRDSREVFPPGAGGAGLDLRRAAGDLGFQVLVAEDACATMDLKFGETVIPADHVHKAFMAALKSYGQVMSAEQVISHLAAEQAAAQAQ